MKDLKSTELVQHLFDENNIEENNSNIEYISNECCQECGSKIRVNSNFCYKCGNKLKEVPYILSKSGKMIDLVPDVEMIKKNKKRAFMFFIIYLVLFFIKIIGILISRNFMPSLETLISIGCLPIELIILVAIVINFTNKEYKRAEVDVDNIEEIRHVVKNSENSNINIVSKNEYIEQENIKKVKGGIGIIIVIVIIFMIISFIITTGHALGEGCKGATENFFEMVKGCE